METAYASCSSSGPGSDVPRADLPGETNMHIVHRGEIYDEVDGQYQYTYTHVVYEISGRVFMARTHLRCPDWDEIKSNDLTDPIIIPFEAYAPLLDPTLTVLDRVPSDCFVKRPKLGSYNVDAPHQVADSFLAEARTCELLRQNPHPNIGRYLGCRVRDGRITGLCFIKYSQTLMDRVNPRHFNKRACGGSGWAPDVCNRFLQEIEKGLRHLYSLGLVHNDVNPANIMFDNDDKPVIIDFGSCVLIGQGLEVTGRTYEWYDDAVKTSTPSNDFDALTEIGEWMSNKPVKNFKFKE